MSDTDILDRLGGAPPRPGRRPRRRRSRGPARGRPGGRRPPGCRGDIPDRRASDAIRRDELRDVLVGAGTVLTVTQVDQAVAAGAQFVVSPGTSRAVVECATSTACSCFPVPSRPPRSWRRSHRRRTVKFFPAGTSGGGPPSRRSPHRSVASASCRPAGRGPWQPRRVPALPSVRAVGGSRMVPKGLVNAGDLDGIRELTAARSRSPAPTARPDPAGPAPASRPARHRQSCWPTTRPPSLDRTTARGADRMSDLVGDPPGRGDALRRGVAWRGDAAPSTLGEDASARPGRSACGRAVASTTSPAPASRCLGSDRDRHGGR